MRSFISGSDRSQAVRASTALLVSLLAYVCLLEVATRIGMTRINHVWRSIETDHRLAISLRPSAADGSTTILIVGNSYLELGVNRGDLRRAVSPSYSVAYLPISGTGFLDWYFGLRRLFAEGARPAYVGLCLSTRDVISDVTSGESFAHTLMLGSDILEVRARTRLDNTAASNYVFANASSWLGHRAEIRNWLLRKTVPAVPNLVRFVRPRARPLPAGDLIVAKALPRLRMLDRLCREHGARCFLLIPPSRNLGDASDALREAAAREGLLVVLTFQQAELPETAFLDGSHLNSQGAVLFTERLGPSLISSLESY